MRLFIMLSLALLVQQTAFAQNAALGIHSHHIGKETAQKRGYFFPYGSLVRSVNPESAAEALGLQPFDYVYQIDQKKVSREQSISDLLDSYQPGDQVTVYYERLGRLKSGKAILSDGDELRSIHRSSEQDPFLGVSSTHYSIPDELNGAPVNVLNNSTAQAMGMEDKDIITQIDQYPIYSWSDLSAAIDNRSVGDLIQVKYYRDGQFFDESRPIKSRAATHNDHSRPDGPVIVGGRPDPAANPSEVNLVDLSPEMEMPNTEERLSVPVINNIQADQLNVFPNPSDGIFNIQLELPQEGRTSIQVFNSQGQRVYENNLGNFSGTFSDRIDISSTAKGIFFLLIRQDNKTLSKQIVLQ